MKQKIISKLVVIMLLAGLLLMAIQSYNFRSFGVQNALTNASSIGEVVKNGLTAHMINNNMEQRGIFLNSISNMKKIKSLWVIRGENVIQQYGTASNNELARDDIDKRVLKSSEMEYKLTETFSATSLRVTIPYNAEQTSSINCLDCHNVKYGDTLGAVTIVLDISDIKTSGLILVMFILFFTIFAILLIIYFATKTLKPDLETI
ncbi:MAG: GGDEF domain-containing protein, partial [Campylobacterota bacterium]|nr:GGDEF domain-containing protein [Campylobacterota bacterium]